MTGSLRDYRRSVLLHLFGREGYASLQKRRWTAIGIAAPLLGFVSDVMQVLGPLAYWLFVGAGVVFVATLIAILLRTPFCNHCAFPCTASLIAVLVFGIVFALQSTVHAEDKNKDRGVTAQLFPEVAQFQDKVLAALGRIEEKVEKDGAATRVAVGNVLTKIDSNEALAETRHREMMAAISSEKGVEPRFLAPLFEAAEMDKTIPHGQEETHIRAAVDALKARGLEKITPSNLGSEIDAALKVARAKLAMADSEGALVVLRARRKIEADERLHRQRGEALLLSEEATIYRETFRHAPALVALRQATELDPDTAAYWGDLGDIAMTHGDLDQALTAYQGAIAASEKSGNKRNVSVSHVKIGNVLGAQGDLTGAAAAFGRSLAIHETLLARDPGNMEWQRDVSVSHDQIGNVLVAQGDLTGAAAAFGKSLAIRETLLARDPGNMGWQRDVIVSHVKLGEIGESPAAHFMAAHEIAARMKAAGKLNPADDWMVAESKRLWDEAVKAGK